MSTNSEPLKVAVIGLGWWGRTLAGLIGSSTALRVVRVADIDPDAASFVAENDAKFSTAWTDALTDPSVEAIVLCTPHSQHADQIVAAAKAGKHVFCEKPLSMTRSDALRATEAVATSAVRLAVGHEKRFEPPIQQVMRMVKSGELGTPLQIEANFSQDKFLALPADNWRLSGAEAPAGPMTATGIHLLDLSVAVFGEAESVFASVKQLGSPLVNGDTLAALVRFRRGGHALISAMLATPFVGRFAVYGSHGWAEVRDKNHPEAPQGWTLTTCLRGQSPQVVDYPAAPAVLTNLEAFATDVRGGAAYPVPVAEMIANISALEAIFRSAASGVVEAVAS